MIVEEHILELVKKGNTKAFETLFLLYKNKVYNFVCGTTYDKQVSEDITQNVFLAIWEHRESIEPDRNFDAFIFKIARNMVFRHTEKKILAYRFCQKYTTDNSDIIQSTEEDIDSKLLVDTLMVFVDKLPEKSKEIFLLRKIEGLSIKEIALRLELSPKTVENLIYRSVLFLKKNLSKQIFILAMLLLSCLK